MTKSSPTLVPTFLCHTFINIFLPFSLLSPVHCRDLCHRDTPLLSGSTCWDGNTDSPPSNPGHQPSCSSSSPGGVSPCRSSSWSRWCCLPRWPRDCGSNQSCTGQCRNFLQLKWFLSSTDHKLHFIEGSKLFLKSDSSVASICKYYLDTFLSSCESHTHKHSRRWGHRMMHWSEQELLLVVTWQLTSFKRVQEWRQNFSSIIVQEFPLKRMLVFLQGFEIYYRERECSSLYKIRNTCSLCSVYKYQYPHFKIHNLHEIYGKNCDNSTLQMLETLRY